VLVFLLAADEEQSCQTWNDKNMEFQSNRSQIQTSTHHSFAPCRCRLGNFSFILLLGGCVNPSTMCPFCCLWRIHYQLDKAANLLQNYRVALEVLKVEGC